MPRAGLEPAILAKEDFETSVSTSSTIWANVLIYSTSVYPSHMSSRSAGLAFGGMAPMCRLEYSRLAFPHIYQFHHLGASTSYLFTLSSQSENQSLRLLPLHLKPHLHPIEPVHPRKRKSMLHEEVILHLDYPIVVSLLI